MQILERRGIKIGAHISRLHSITDDKIDPVGGDMEKLKALENKDFPVINDDAAEQMMQKILWAKKAGDSVGGIVECVITGVPAGYGDPIYDGIENRIASVVFGVPAVKGIEFGSGFDCALMTGTQHNDPFYLDGETVKTKTNNHGGILGGITSGMPIVFRAAIKPTASVAAEQTSLDIKTSQQVTFRVGGRHDPCIVRRAVPVMQAAAAAAIADFVLK